jgi:hypothetical protein
VASVRPSTAPVSVNAYQRLLAHERHWASHPSYPRALLHQLEVGEPVVVYGFRVGARGVFARVDSDGTVTVLSEDEWPAPGSPA